MHSMKSKSPHFSEPMSLGGYEILVMFEESDSQLFVKLVCPICKRLVESSFNSQTGQRQQDLDSARFGIRRSFSTHLAMSHKIHANKGEGTNE